MLANILAVGLMSMGMGLSGVKDEPQMYAQDEATYTITYENAEDWSSRADDIHTWLDDKNYVYTSGQSSQTAKLDITGTISNYDTLTLTKMYINGTATNKIVLETSSGQSISYDIENSKWTGYTGSNFTLGTLTITSQTYYEGLAEVPPNMGNDIVGTIVSGLGIIGALATEFLGGFTALFYASGNLTPFAIFSLVFLGIAVSFAIVKLVLNIIRGNTGA